jgi:hypothetical protein
MKRNGILLMLIVSLAGCTAESMRDFSLFGYQFGSRARCDIKTVRVPIFRNTTFFRDVEYELTQAVIKRIEDTTPYKVVNGQADAQLLGTIKLGASNVMVQNELNEARQRDLTLIVEVSFVDARTGQDYFMPITVQPALPSTPQPLPQTDVQAPAPQPVSAVPLRPMLFSRSAPYAQETGQSYATARQKVVEDLAIAIVNAMDAPW